MEKTVKESDKTSHASRKALGDEERFREEMKDCFEYYDTSGDGAIDKIEFRSMLMDGSLLRVPVEEVDDYFSQIDKDKGGDIDFEEFFAWFNYEWSKGAGGKVDKTGKAAVAKKKNFSCSKTLSPKKRGINKLLKRYEEGNLEDDFGAKLDKGRRGVDNVDVGVGMEHIEGAKEDRWWLTAEEQLAEGGWEGYLERRKMGLEIMEEKKKVKAEAVKRRAKEEEERQVRESARKVSMAHEDFEGHKSERVAEMKKRLEERAHTPENTPTPTMREKE